jgi:hypothetical protein
VPDQFCKKHRSKCSVANVLSRLFLWRNGPKIWEKTLKLHTRYHVFSAKDVSSNDGSSKDVSSKDISSKDGSSKIFFVKRCFVKKNFRQKRFCQNQFCQKPSSSKMQQNLSKMKWIQSSLKIVNRQNVFHCKFWVPQQFELNENLNCTKIWIELNVGRRTKKNVGRYHELCKIGLFCLT